MCLTLTKNSEKETKKLIEHRKKVSKKNYIIAYKNARLKGDNLYPYYRANSWGPYKIGENVSNRNGTKLNYAEKERGEIMFGFHVYLNKKDAKQKTWVNKVIIPIKIYLDDIVSIGHFGGEDSLVCTKFTISEKDYNKAIKKG